MVLPSASLTDAMSFPPPQIVQNDVIADPAPLRRLDLAVLDK